MKTADAMIHEGNWLFRHRCYLPLITLLFAFFCIWVQRSLYLTESFWYDLFCLLIAFGGESIRIIAVGYSADRTSGRNTKQQVADEINQTGIYSLVRHPLYIGNFFIWLGVALFCRIWWLVVIFILVYLFYYERIILAEESFLESKFGDGYRLYADKVNALRADFRRYVPNKYHFRVRKVIRQENSTVYAIVLVFLCLEIIQELAVNGRIGLEIYWWAIGILFTVLYLVVRTIKKTTRLLHNEPQREKIAHQEQ